MIKTTATYSLLKQLAEFAEKTGCSYSKVCQAFEIGQKYLFEEESAQNDSIAVFQKMKWKRKKEVLRCEWEVITQELNKNHIRHLLIKGLAFDELICDETLERTFSDIDILVDPAKIEEAVSVLQNLGYAGMYSKF